MTKEFRCYFRREDTSVCALNPFEDLGDKETGNP
jgi:hypothetical protein